MPYTFNPFTSNFDYYEAAAAPVPTTTLTNRCGANTIIGYVYRLDPDFDESFDYALADEDMPCCVASEVAANGAACEVYLTGIQDVYVTGTTDRDDYLYFSGTNGQAKPLKERYSGCIGKAVESRAGAGLVKVDILPHEVIKKWAWSQEGSWSHSLLLPFGSTNAWGTEFAGNPVLTDSPAPSWENGAGVRYAQVIIYEGAMYMVYASGGGFGLGIGIARSTDGLVGHAFEKYPLNPIAVAGGAGWRQNIISCPAIMYDEFETDPSRVFKMLVCGQDAGGVYDWGYYYAPHPWGPWTEYILNPVMNALHFGCGVFRAGDLFIALVGRNAMRNIRCTTSRSFSVWNTVGDIMTVGGAGAWDDTFVSFASLYFNQGTWYCVYSGCDAVGGTWRIGMAQRSEFWGTYTKFCKNYIIGPGAGGSWNSFGVLSPSLIQVNNQFKLYATGRPAAGANDDAIGVWEETKVRR